jgi:hypothetical protein
MRKVLLAALITACVALLAPALAGAAIRALDVTAGNDSGARSAVVNYALPTTAAEGALVGPTICLPVPGSTFALGTTTINCSSFVDGGCIEFPPGICLI